MLDPVKTLEALAKISPEARDLVSDIATTIVASRSTAALVGEALAAMVATMPDDVREAYDAHIDRLARPSESRPGGGAGDPVDTFGGSDF